MAANRDAVVSLGPHRRRGGRRRCRGSRLDRQPGLHRAAPASRCAPAISIIPTNCASISTRAPASNWADVRAVALEVKALLDEMGLRGWPKTSGSRGMHVNVRIQPRWTFGEVRRAAVALSRAVERRVPALASSKWWKEERHGVFLDYNQNAKDRTTCSAYSVRPLPDARVSTPLHWHEVPDCEPADFTDPHRSAALRRNSAIRTRAWTPPPDRSNRCWSWPHRDEAAGLGDAPWPPHFRKMEGEAPRVAPSRARSAAARSSRATTMPLLVVANSPDQDAALAGLERWKSKHPEAAGLLAVDDVLVDSMRGRSSTWTRIRVNLRHVPEALRPPQETPDPDDDPTREWRELRAKRASKKSSEPSPGVRRTHRPAKIAANSCGGTTSSCAYVQSRRLLVRAPPSKMRHVPEARALHVLVGDFDHQLGPQRLPRQVLALAPAALAARHPLPGFPIAGRMLGPLPSTGDRSSASSRYGARNSASSRRFSSVKLAQTPTCCSAPESSKSPSSSEPTCRALAFLVPAKPGDHAVAIALVLDLEHHALVRLVGPRDRLGDDAVEPRALEAAKPVRRQRSSRALPASDGSAAPRRKAAPPARGGALETAGSADRGSPSESRSKNTIDAGICWESSFTRDAAGCRRSCSASKSRPPFRAMTISPSSTQRAGNCDRSGSINSGK